MMFVGTSGTGWLSKVTFARAALATQNDSSAVAESYPILMDSLRCFIAASVQPPVSCGLGVVEG